MLKPDEYYYRTLYTACPLCDSADIHALTQFDCRQHVLWQPPLPWVINWSTCNHCKHVFTSGYFGGDAATFLFSGGQESQKVQVSEQERAIWARVVDMAAANTEMKAPGSWLDVGFGSGGLLMTATEFGYRPVGLDLREKNVLDMEAMGYSAFKKTIEEFSDIDPNGGPEFDVISVMDVLEHMPFPRTALDAAHKLLEPGGMLIVSCPNTDTAVWRALDDANKNPYWVEIEHYHNFTRKTLIHLLEAHHFRPVIYRVSERYRSCMEIYSIREGV